MSKSQKIASAIIVAIIALVASAVTYFTDLGDTFKKDSLPDIKPSSNADLSVHFIDVGQGDCTLVMCEGHSMLIDAGESDQGEWVVEYLLAQGIKNLDYVIGTHPHSDHIGGLKAVVNSDIEIGKIIMPKVPDEQVPTSYTYTKLRMAIIDKGLTITNADDSTFNLGSAVINTYTPKDEYNDLNDYSVATKITHGDNSFLITGDLGKKSEQELVKRGCDLSARVLQVCHHGSRESSSDLFLSKVKPVYAVIQCGEGNSYGHPHEEALNRLDKYTKEIYTTDKDGTILFESDGEGLNIKTIKSDNETHER